MFLLNIGSAGADVQNLQVMLNRVVTAPPLLQPDGLFGPKTRARVVQFQTNSGLVADGIVGPITRDALVAAVLTATLQRY